MNALTDVYCRNPFCSFAVRRGKGRLVGRINGQAELSCSVCHQVALYDSTAAQPPARVTTGVSRA